MRRALAWPVALLAGVAHTFSFAPFELWWLQLVALAVLASLVADAGVWRAAVLGWLFGVGWLVSGLWWLYISMHDFGGMPSWLAALAVFALAGLLALYYAAALALFARCRRGRPDAPFANALIWAACWLLAELARGVCFTGFPWIASGYAHAVGPLAGWAPWVGVYGISALAAAVAWMLAAILRPGGRPELRMSLGVGALIVLVMAAPLALPSRFTQPAGTLSVSLLQPNIAQNLKFDPALMDGHLRALVRQIGAARGTLVVTPESVIPFTRGELSGAYWDGLARPFEGTRRALLIGVFLGNADEGYVNSVVGISGGSATAGGEYHYGKRHLLPFGEFVPPGFRWFVDLMQIPLGDQAHGQSSAPFDVGGQRLRPLICFEDLFGEDVVASVVGARPATMFVNVSNLAWFGPRLVQDQHLQFSQMRALEFERPVIRSTNTGATAVVDHHGRVTARLPPLVEGTLDANVEGRIGETPYARWLAAAGLWPLAIVAVALLLVLRRRR
ncbi:MAG: apolipoprotein N-acyltransferase [Rhizobacter sp.]|nr:apolipoprotein N-acyltransferase [Rhizobacter sp.]